MKNIITPLIFFYCLSIFSQKSNDYHGKIIYNQVTNFGFEFIEEYQLVFTKNWSYSEEININKKESYQTSNSDNNGTSTINVIGRKNMTPKYYYNTNNTFFFRDNFSDNIFVVKETPSFPKWNLINENKKIVILNVKKLL
jgi:GLPGLI family protein